MKEKREKVCAISSSASSLMRRQRAGLRVLSDLCVLRDWSIAPGKLQLQVSRASRSTRVTGFCNRES